MCNTYNSALAQSEGYVIICTDHVRPAASSIDLRDIPPPTPTVPLKLSDASPGTDSFSNQPFFSKSISPSTSR